MICYLIALGGAGALGGFVLLLGLDQLPMRVAWPDPWPWLIDIGWLAAFGVQHSGMARASFKRFWAGVIPSPLERSVYTAVSGVMLIGLVLTWQPIGGEAFWRLSEVLIVVPLMAAAALVAVSLRFDHAEFFGLRQGWAADAAPRPDQLLVLGPYRYVRHPLMAYLLIFLWAQPVMTPTLALLSGGLSLYIGVGIVLEERDLLRRFGPAYAEYRRRVPALVPWRRPAAPAVYPSRPLP